MVLRRTGFWCIFKKDHPANKRPGLFPEGAFPVRGPKIVRRADSFFCAVVKNLTPADVYFGRGQTIVKDWDRTCSPPPAYSPGHDPLTRKLMIPNIGGPTKWRTSVHPKGNCFVKRY